MVCSRIRSYQYELAAGRVKIAVLEFVCGGGLIPDTTDSVSSGHKDQPDEPTYRELFREGFGMLEALAADLASCGHEVFTCIDQYASDAGATTSLARHSVQAHPVKSNTPWLEQWRAIATGCDTAIVIAPELDHHLIRIVEYLRKQHVSVLASSSEFLEAASDKLLTSELLKSKSIPHPETWSVEAYRSLGKQARDVIHDRPVTLKRRDGAGCVSMLYFPNQNALDRFLDCRQLTLDLDNMLVQPWLPGQPASLAVLVRPNGHMLLGCFEQHIRIVNNTNEIGDAAVVYGGGCGPAMGVSPSDLEHFAQKVLMAMPAGALGWIGMDFLIPVESSAQELVLIEINPRLTTSYLGYRQWYGAQLANLLTGSSLSLASFCWQNSAKIDFRA